MVTILLCTAALPALPEQRPCNLCRRGTTPRPRHRRGEPVTHALIADLASARRLGVAIGAFGTIWDIGEAAGPIVAGFLIVGLGYPSTFDILALITVAVSIGLLVLVRDPSRSSSS